MIKGQMKTPTWEEVLKLTDGGYDIYMNYLGEAKSPMNRPWGNKIESKKSWSVKPYSGVWYWKDHATEESGTAIQMVQRVFKISFEQALYKICSDFGFIEDSDIVPLIKTWEPPYGEDKEYVKINFSDKPFTEKHHSFWNIVETSEKDCRDKNCFAVKDLSIKGRKVNIGKDEIVFAFYAPEENAVKIYFPERDPGNKFRNNVSYHYLWNMNNVQSCEDLIIQKSPKDMIVTCQVQPCTIATQAEAIKIFDEPTVDRIHTISYKPWLFYGSDPDGVRKSTEITNKFRKWRYVNTPKYLLPGVNDTYSFVKMHNLQKMGTGLKELEKFLKFKKVLSS